MLRRRLSIAPSVSHVYIMPDDVLALRLCNGEIISGELPHCDDARLRATVHWQGVESSVRCYRSNYSMSVAGKGISIIGYRHDRLARVFRLLAPAGLWNGTR